MAKSSRIKVEVDTGDSEAQLRKLQAAVDAATEALIAAQKSRDPKRIAAANRELKAAKTAVSEYRTELNRTARAGKDLGKMSLNELRASYRELRKEVAGMERGTREYAARVQELNRVKRELDRVEASMKRVSRAQRGMGGGFAKVMGVMQAATGPIIATVAALAGVLRVVRKAVDSFRSLQERTQQLSSLTGLQGDDLTWLQERAQALGTTTTEAGVRITKSAEEIVEAFTLMGSAKPELLSNKEALSSVTEAALTLAEAAGMDTSAAVGALANTMNQFGAPAAEAERYINALAAGAKAGSASVEDVSKSIVKFGATASMANLSVEESVGLVEALASKGIKGEVAGTGLNAVLLKLQTGADEFNPKVVGLNKALENLGNAGLTTQQKVKLFGEGNIAVGESLIQLRGDVARLTNDVTGTSEATLQAAKNTDTLSARLSQAGNQMLTVLISIGQSLAPLFQSAMEYVTQFLGILKRIWDVLEPVREVIGTILGLVLDGIAGLLNFVVGLAEMESATERYTKALLDEQNALEMLFGTLRDAKAGTEAHRQALESINKQYGDYLPRLLDEKSSLDEIAQAQRIATQALQANMVAKQRALELENAHKQALETRRKGLEELNAIIAKHAGQSAAVLRAEVGQILAMEDRAAQSKAMETFAARFAQYNGVFTNVSRNVYVALWRIRQQSDEAAEGVAHINEEFDQLEATIAKPKRVRVQAEVETVPAKTSEPAKPGATPASSPATTPQLRPKDPNAALARELKEAQDLTEEWYAKARATRLKAYAKEVGDKRKLDGDLRQIEFTYLLKRRADLQRFGKSTLQIDLQIAQREVQIAQDKHDQLKAQEAEAERARKAQRDKEDKESEARRKKEEQDFKDAQAAKLQQMQESAERMQGMAEGFGQLIGEFIADAQMSQQAFGRRVALMALDSLHKVVRTAIASIWAQSLATADSIYTFGASGTVRAALLTGLVEAAFATARGYLTQQHFTGRLVARGADDGQTYHVPYLGAVTGVTYVQNPALISERGGEIIIDHARSRNIQLRYPWLLDQIRAVPQHARGTLPAASSASSASARHAPGGAADSKALHATLAEVSRALSELQGTLRGGIEATIRYGELKDKWARGQRAEGLR